MTPYWSNGHVDLYQGDARNLSALEDESVQCVVLDPFVGSGTVPMVAQKLGRKGIGVDLSAEYLELARKRVEGVPLPMVLR